jgi:hypothetical protein
MFDAFSFQMLDTVPALKQLVHCLPNLMPNVGTMDLIHHGFGIKEVFWLESAAHAFASITHLRVCCNRGPIHTENILRFVSLFPRLEALEFVGHETHIIIPDVKAVHPVRPNLRHLKHLTLGPTFYPGGILTWLTSGAVQVDDLRIKSWGHEWSSLRSLLLSVADRLLCLRLREGVLTLAEDSTSALLSIQQLKIEFKSKCPGCMSHNPSPPSPLSDTLKCTSGSPP